MADLCYQGTATSAIRGVDSAETDFDVTDFEQTWDDPKDYKMDEDETPIGFWAGHKKKQTYSVTGEITTALTAIPATTACSGVTALANSIDGYGVSAGGIYLDSLSVKMARAQIATFTMSASRHPNIA